MNIIDLKQKFLDIRYENSKSRQVNEEHIKFVKALSDNLFMKLYIGNMIDRSIFGNSELYNYQIIIDFSTNPSVEEISEKLFSMFSIRNIKFNPEELIKIVPIIENDNKYGLLGRFIIPQEA